MTIKMRLVCGVVLLLPLLAVAETAYVTDNLRLGLHQAADTSDRAFRTLDSGQELEILTRDRNYAHVSLPDGVQGYVKAAYLVDEKPAKLIVAETQAEVITRSTDIDIVVTAVIADHQVDGFRAQQPRPVQGAAIQQHLTEAPVIGSG